VGDRRRFGVMWDGQIYDLDLWAIPKNAKNKDVALRFISFATDPARLAVQAELIAYGPMRKSALPLVGKHPVIAVEMTPFLPTAPDNFKRALQFDEAWWNANGAALQTRFETWRGPLAPGQGKPPIVEAKPQEEEPIEDDAKAQP
jgi:putative spermidine/putrescine transport system substrate-binding protein